jgi:WhiB family transcriptional regulator, redox-sensing transcriptional regulator
MSRDDITELAPFLFVAQPWAPSALCAQVDGELFFPGKGGANVVAKRFRARCPVRRACLRWAIATDQRFGIWGGLSTAERDQLRRTGKVAA